MNLYIKQPGDCNLCYLQKPITNDYYKCCTDCWDKTTGRSSITVGCFVDWSKVESNFQFTISPVPYEDLLK